MEQIANGQLVGDSRIIALVKNLDMDQAQKIVSRFGDAYKLAEEWKARAASIKVRSEFETDAMKMARAGRLEIKEKRVAIERTRKEMKERSLNEGRAIDSVAKELTALLEPIETYLEDQERFAERAAQARKDQLASARLAAFRQVTQNPWQAFAGVPADKWNDVSLADLTEDAFAAAYAKAEASVAAELARAEAEAAKARQEAAERERLRAENEKLRQEREKAEKAAADERRKREAEAAAAEKAKQQAAAKLAAEKAKTEQKVEKAALGAYDTGWNDALKAVYTDVLTAAHTDLRAQVKAMKKN